MAEGKVKGKRASGDRKPAGQTNSLIRYFRETRGELRKVTWPSRAESQRLTIIVLGVSLAFAIFLWLFDAIFSNALRVILEAILG